MVRKLKETADWFKHPCELRNTTQMRAIRRKFSNDGYAVYNYLIEMMCGAKNFELEYSKKLIALYCADFDVSEKKFTEIVDFCVAIDVFFIDKKNQKLTSPDLKEYLEGLLNFRERDRNRKANNHSHQIAKIHMENENIHMENGQSIEENRKEKERKDNNSLRSSLSLPPSTTTPPAHARKSFGDEKGDCDHDDPMTANEGVGILKTDKDWLLQVQRKFALDKSIILGWLDSFCNDCNCRGKQQHENLADVKQHFIDWMSKQLNSKNNKNTCKEKVIKITPEKIWLRCQAELSQSVSDEITKQTIESLIFENYDAKSSILLLDIPNRKCSEYIEENCITTLTKVLQKHFGKNIKLNYRLPEYP